MNVNSSHSSVGLERILVALADIGVIPAAELALAKSMRPTGVAMREAVMAKVPAFYASGNPDIMPGLEQHASENIAEIHRLFSGGELIEFSFIKAHARRRAEQRFPLEAILAAYRCGHRVLSRWLREAALALRPSNIEHAVSAVADFSVEYVDTISTIATAEYVAHTRLIAESEGDRRTELMNILLSGYDESDGRVAQILKRAGYLEQRQVYCVAVCQSTNPAEMSQPERAQRIVSSISQAAAPTSIRMLAGVRNNLVTVVFSDKRRQSGWTAPQSNLAARVRPVLEPLGTAVLVGISADHPATSALPTALREAMIALDFTSVARRVAQFSELPIRDLLVQHGRDYVQAAPPRWIAALAGADDSLIQTLRAVAEADLNLQKAGRILGRHPNTVYMRLEKIKDLTGLDGQRYRDLTELLLAADCWAR